MPLGVRAVMGTRFETAPLEVHWVLGVSILLLRLNVPELSVLQAVATGCRFYETSSQISFFSNICVCVHEFVCVLVCMCVRLCICVCECMHVCVSECTCVYVSVCICVFVYLLRVYACVCERARTRERESMYN